ncbi:MAG: PaaI family thioesterase [Thermodesulfobacteriota bacterium]|nr:PaaI family thioesterase [Thermodesulfobacteriota bacterium]
MNKERFDFLKKDYVQGFPAFCGFQVRRVAYGEFETRLEIRPDHRQQDGFVHAGVIATMADHTGGYAAYTTASEETRILTIEFKINYFRPAKGEAIVCRSRVVNRGKKIIVSESEVSCLKDGQEKPVSKAMITLMAMPASKFYNPPRE